MKLPWQKRAPAEVPVVAREPAPPDELARLASRAMRAWLRLQTMPEQPKPSASLAEYLARSRDPHRAPMRLSDFYLGTAAALLAPETPDLATLRADAAAWAAALEEWERARNVVEGAWELFSDDYLEATGRPRRWGAWRTERRAEIEAAFDAAVREPTS